MSVSFAKSRSTSSVGTTATFTRSMKPRKKSSPRKSTLENESSHLRPVRQLFNEFAKVKERGSESASHANRPYSRKSLPLPDDSDSEENKAEARITVEGLHNWFHKSQIFSSPVCKVTSYDLKTLFSKTERHSLSFNQFEHFLIFLCHHRKVHTSTLLLRLQLHGSPLQQHVFQTTAPEGTVDRVVDAFRLEAEQVTEHFINLSKVPYEEPIGLGGIGNPGMAHGGTKKEEEKELVEKAKSMMRKGEDAEKSDSLTRNFIYFAKNGNSFSDGRSMELTQLIKWMKQAGVIDGTNITAIDIGYIFKRLYSLNWRIFQDDLRQFIKELAMWKNMDENAMHEKLRNCDPPGSSSISLINMTIPQSMLEMMKKSLSMYSEEFEEKRDQFEPTLADTPYGHTPNSTNRHFRNFLEEEIVKVKSKFLEELKRGKLGEASALVSDAQSGKRGTLEGDEKDEVFSEEKRTAKDMNAKRWHDAYPIGGMETSHRGRLEVDVEKMLFGERQDDSSSDDEDKAKMKMLRTKFILTGAAPPTTAHPPIPLEEQFDKYKRFGEHKHDDGLTLNNILLWFQFAGLIASHGTTVYSNKEIEDTFKQFKFATDNGYMDLDNFNKFVESLGEIKGKHTNGKEIRERLCRCGPPRKAHSTHQVFIKEQDTAKRTESKKSLTQRLEEEDDSDLPVPFKTRFQEFSRFGEPTVDNQQFHNPGISMLNANKWFKQAKLHERGYNPGDVDVLFKQLYATKQRIQIREFIKLLEQLGHTTSSKETSAQLMEVFGACGSPEITEKPPNVHRPKSLSTTSSRLKVKPPT